MPRVKKTDDNVLSDPDEIVQESSEDEKAKGEQAKRIQKLLARFKQENDFICTLYRVGEKGKTFWCDEYNGEIPDLHEIRKTFGAGSFKYYITDVKGELLDYAVVHIDGIPGTGNPVQVQPNTRTEILADLATMKTIIGGESNQGNINELIMKMSENNLAMFEKITAMQAASEKRVMDLMLESKKEKTSLKDMLEIVEMVDDLRGGAGKEPEGMIDKLLNSPMIGAALGKLVVGDTPQAVQQPAPALPVPAEPSRLSDKCTPEFLEKVKPENREMLITAIMEQLKIDRDRATSIVIQLLKEKGF